MGRRDKPCGFFFGDFVGYYVHLHVCFACDENEPLARVAKKVLPEIEASDCNEAKWFLQDLAKRTGNNPGSKGGLSLWGIVGNYTRAERFIEVLMPFWKALYASDNTDDDCGFCGHEHILVFEETEQSEQTTAHEIKLDEERRTIVVSQHKCTFAFMQF